MQYTTLFFLFQCLIFFNQYETLNAKAFIGNSVRRATEKEFTSVVSISVKRAKFDALADHICTGALITRKHVLTAEHCMRCNFQTDMQVIAGSNNIYKGKSYRLKEWISYEQWIASKHYQLEYQENDISIITLARTINDPEIVPSSLTTKSNRQLFGQEAIMAGWGRTNTQRIAILMETTMVTILANDHCLKRVTNLAKKKMVIPDSVFCSAANPYALMDCGESGGPIFDTDNFLIGVNEGTSPKTEFEMHPEEVNVHSSINYYRNFIMDVIREL